VVVSSVAFSGDGLLLLTGSYDGRAFLRNTWDKTCIQEFTDTE
jgi:WD40 repeat protein